MNNNKPKIQLPSRVRKVASGSKPQAPADDAADARIIALARRWVDLHAKPKTRDQMDSVLVGLTETEIRAVILCGQRICCGLSPKVVKP